MTIPNALFVAEARVEMLERLINKYAVHVASQQTGTAFLRNVHRGDDSPFTDEEWSTLRCLYGGYT